MNLLLLPILEVYISFMYCELISARGFTMLINQTNVNQYIPLSLRVDYQSQMYSMHDPNRLSFLTANF